MNNIGGNSSTITKAESSSSSSLSSSAPCVFSSLVPLRDRVSLEAGARKGEEEMENKQRRRSALWPTKAIFVYCRMLLQCSPITTVEPGQHLTRQSFSLKPHWRQDELKAVGSVFDSVSAHSTAFFPLVVEESRELQLSYGNSAPSRIPRSGGDRVFDEERRKMVEKAPHGNVWLSANVTELIPFEDILRGNAKLGNYSTSSSESLSCVWMVTLVSDETLGLDHEFIGGDLLLLHSASLKRRFLGILHSWDPDFEHTKGQVNTHSAQKADEKEGGVNTESKRYEFKALVCICLNSHIHDTCGSSTGGWIPKGVMCVGRKFSIVAIANVMTAMREAQALMSLKYIDNDLKNALLNERGLSDETSTAFGHNSHLSSPKSQDYKPPSQKKLQKPPSIPMALWATLLRDYNTSQLIALCNICRQGGDPITLLQGPPGTGKTRTILALVGVILSSCVPSIHKTRTGQKIVVGASLTSRVSASSISLGSSTRSKFCDDGDCANNESTVKKLRVLICAPSNTAADEITYRLITQGVLDSNGERRQSLSIVRIGNSGVIHQGGGVERRLALSSSSSLEASSFLSSQFNEQTSSVTREVYEVLLDCLIEKKRAAHNYRKTVLEARKEILFGADVVVSTLSGAGSQALLEVVIRSGNDFKFDAVIIDEAAQASEPSALIPFKFNPKSVILVGDPCQLPATVISNVAKRANLGQSLFQRLNNAGYPVLRLEIQYRMHKEIAEYPSLQFYNGRLFTDEQVVKSGSHHKMFHANPKFRPFSFHNVSHGQQEQEGTSIRNNAEADYILNLYLDLETSYPHHQCRIGIITPYDAQRISLKKKFKSLRKNFFKDDLQKLNNCDIEISTVDGFQGREVDIVIFSCVRSIHTNYNRSRVSKDGNGASLGFVADVNRLNVAMTRAKFSLIIVGNAEYLGASNTEWKNLVDFARRKGYMFPILKNAVAYGTRKPG